MDYIISIHVYHINLRNHESTSGNQWKQYVKNKLLDEPSSFRIDDLFLTIDDSLTYFLTSKTNQMDSSNTNIPNNINDIER